jgi:hypothetical protein
VLLWHDAGSGDAERVGAGAAGLAVGVRRGAGIVGVGNTNGGIVGVGVEVWRTPRTLVGFFDARINITPVPMTSKITTIPAMLRIMRRS